MQHHRTCGLLVVVLLVVSTASVAATATEAVPSCADESALTSQSDLPFEDGEPHQCSNPELADATELGDWVPAETKPKQGGRKAGAVHKSMLLETGDTNVTDTPVVPTYEPDLRACPKLYILQESDTAASLSARFKVNPTILVDINPCLFNRSSVDSGSDFPIYIPCVAPRSEGGQCMQYVDTAPGMTAVDVAAAWLTNVNDVMAINNLTAVELPEGTSRVLIPSCKINVAPVSLKPSTTANKTRACPSIYKTAGGETVYEIADAHKVTFAQILAVNPMLLDPSTRLEAGVAVLIPCTTTAPAKNLIDSLNAVPMKPKLYEGGVNDTLAHNIVNAWREQFSHSELVELNKTEAGRRKLLGVATAAARKTLAMTLKNAAKEGAKKVAKWLATKTVQIAVKAILEANLDLAKGCRIPDNWGVLGKSGNLKPISENGGNPFAIGRCLAMDNSRLTYQDCTYTTSENFVIEKVQTVAIQTEQVDLVRIRSTLTNTCVVFIGAYTQVAMGDCNSEAAKLVPYPSDPGMTGVKLLPGSTMNVVFMAYSYGGKAQCLDAHDGNMFWWECHGYDNQLFEFNLNKLGCMINSYGRGVGTIPDTCRSGTEKNGLLCYPWCSGGYYGVGPVCWEYCPGGWTDLGLSCSGRWETYEASGGCPWWWFDWCSLWNDCKWCSRGGTRWGCFCTIAEFKWKNSYGRGWGESMICNPGGDKPEYDAGLCYPRCGNNYRGVGPVCYAQKCPPGYPVKCNEISCGRSESDCNTVRGTTAAWMTVEAVGLVGCLLGSILTAGIGAVLFCDIPYLSPVALASEIAWNVFENQIWWECPNF